MRVSKNNICSETSRMRPKLSLMCLLVGIISSMRLEDVLIFRDKELLQATMWGLDNFTKLKKYLLFEKLETENIKSLIQEEIKKLKTIGVISQPTTTYYDCSLSFRPVHAKSMMNAVPCGAKKLMLPIALKVKELKKSRTLIKYDFMYTDKA